MIASTRSAPPRLFIVDPNLKSLHGHYYGYAARVGRAAAAFGVEPVILASVQAAVPATTVPVVPVLSNDYWHEMGPVAQVDPYVHLEHSVRLFADELGRALRAAGASADDAVFLPYANLVELEGMARLSEVLPGGGPRLAFLFRREIDEQGQDSRVGTRTIASLLRRALAVLRGGAAGNRVRLLTDSDALTEDYAERLQFRVQTAPIPVDARFTALARARAERPIVISYFGDARGEKGYDRIPAVAAMLRPRLAAGDIRLLLQSNFNMPGGEPGMAAARTALAAFPGTHLLYDPLEDDEYCGYMAQSHLVLLPYQADRYVARTSGILAEAIHAGVPVVVPEGTWLAEQIRHHGAGVTFNPWQPDAFTGAITRALERLPDLLARAEDRRPAFVAFHNPDRLARFACGADVLERAARVVA